MTASPQTTRDTQGIPVPGHFWIGTALIAAALAGTAYLLVFPLGPDAPYAGCPLNRMTGLYCIGCGTTRAMNALIHGDVLGALSFNVLAMAVAAAVMVFAVHSIFRGVTGRELIHVKVTIVRVLILIGVGLLFFILRNVPVFPFTVLAP